MDDLRGRGKGWNDWYRGTVLSTPHWAGCAVNRIIQGRSSISSEGGFSAAVRLLEDVVRGHLGAEQGIRVGGSG